MGWFSRTPDNRPQFTGQEITALIILASVIDLDKLGLNGDPQVEAVITKAKSVVQVTEKTDGGFTTYCPPIAIVGL